MSLLKVCMNENVTEGGERKQRYCYGVRLRLQEEKQILLPYWQALHELINPQKIPDHLSFS